MKTRLTSLLLLTAFILCISTSEAAAARFIRASISFDGNVILEGSTSDAGKTDADGVWDYLKAMKFKPTEAFETLNVDATAQKTVLIGPDPNGSQPREPGGVPREIVVYIAYGGTAKPWNLKLVRVPKDDYGREWSLDPAEVDGMFNLRLISRELASKLRKPSTLKPWRRRD